MVDIVTLDIEDDAIARIRDRDVGCSSRWYATADGVGSHCVDVKPLITLSSTPPRCLHVISYSCHTVSYCGR
jgi:hypothetical protein